MQTSLDISQVDALAEIRKLKLEIESYGNHEFRIICPFHDDTRPSCCVTTKKNVFVCKTAECAKTGDIVTLLCALRGTTRDQETTRLKAVYPDANIVKYINPKTVEDYFENFGKAPAYMRKALQERGITKEDLREARIGFDGERITIPVFDASGACINIRRYDPKAPGSDKYKNTAGYGGDILYQEKDLQDYSKVMLCGGELKSRVAKRLLNPHGIGAICFCASEGTWNPEYADRFKGKTIYVCMDVDAAGQVAARKLAKVLFPLTEEVSIVYLPLNPDAYPKGDLNDYVGQEGATAEDLLGLIEKADVFEIKFGTEAPDLPLHRTTLLKATAPKYVGKRVGFRCVAVAADTTPYLVPKVVGVACDQKQKGCATCGIYGHAPNPETGYFDIKLSPCIEGILEMVESPKAKMPQAIKNALGIPYCRVVRFSVRDYFKAVDVRLAPEISITNNDGSNTVQPGLIVDSEVELNTPYEVEAVIHPSPKNQQAVFLINDVKQAEDSLDTYSPTENELQELDCFRADSDSLQDIDAKLSEIYADIEANVTRIFERRDLHLLYDLTAHSSLLLNFEERTVPGWINSIVVGDSSQGKSEVANRLGEHYGAGERADCKNATVAGLLGGLQQIGNRWFVSWGVIPTHDRRLVVLEEVKGCHPEVLGRLTDMRSRGIAEIPKIERRRAHARTRLVFISNPRSARPLSAFNFGLEAIREVVGALEDIRRFDLSLIVSADEISAARVSKLMANRPKVEHVFTHTLCKRLLLYAWTRAAGDITFTDNATAKVIDGSITLCDKYDESMPFIDRGTARFKIARLAAALALRLYATEGSKVVVRKGYVEWVLRWIDRLYSSAVFGYGAYSQSQKQAVRLLDRAEVEKQIRTTKYPKDFVQLMLLRESVAVSDVMDACSVEQEVAHRLVSFFVRKRCLIRKKRNYTKTPEFIQVLKDLENKIETAPSAAESL